MRKIMSIMLAVALVLTTLALPMSAFAVDPTETLTLSYELAENVENVKKGDTVTVNAVLKSSGNDVKLAAWFVKMDGAEGFTYAAPTGTGITAEAKGTGYYVYNESTETTVTAEGVTIFSTVVTVGDVAKDVSYTLGTIADQSKLDTSAVGDATTSYFEYALTINNLTLIGANHSAAIKVVDAEGVDVPVGSTAYTNKVTVSVIDATSTYSAEITSADAVGFETITFTEGTKDLTIKGTYNVKVTLIDGAVATREIKLDPTVISASISTAFTSSTGDVYKKGTVITMPLVLDLGDNVAAKAGMVTFTLDIDDAFLTLAENAHATLNSETGLYEFKYEDAARYADGATLDTLTFTVGDGVGATDINFENAQVAMEGDLSGDKLAAGMEDVTIVVEIDKFFTVSGINTQLDNEGKITVAANDDAVELKYIVEEGTVTEPVDAAALFDKAESVPEEIVLDSDKKTYIILARIGKAGHYVYQAEVYDATDLNLDTTAPTVTGAADMPGFKSTIGDVAVAVDLNGIVANDANGVNDTFKYAISNDVPASYTEDATEVTVAANTSVNSKLWLVYTDVAGNDSVPVSFAIKYDGAAPEITGITVDEVADENGKKTLSFTVTDEENGSGVKEVKVYKGTVAEGVVVDGLAVDGPAYSIELSDDATYTIVAVDNTVDNVEKHTATVEKAVEFAEATAKDINVAVVKGTELKSNGFFSVEDFVGADGEGGEGTIDLHDAAGALIDTNGTFTYVKVEIPAANAGFEDEIAIMNGEVDLYEEGKTTYEFADDGNYVITIKSNRVGSDAVATAVYKFSIVKADAMVTVNGDNRYNIVDYARMKAMLATEDKTPSDDFRFVGGYFSGDVTGNLANEAGDFDAILESLMAGKVPGTYNFNVLNPTTAPDPEPAPAE